MKSLFFQFVALSIICILIVYSQKYRCIEQFTQTVKFDDDIYKVVQHTNNHVNSLNDTIDINYSEILNEFCKKRSFFKIDMKGIDLNEKRELIIKSKTSSVLALLFFKLIETKILFTYQFLVPV